MGILNCTPDSFYDGGKFVDEKFILQQVEKMLIDGASIIDVGGASSKPNASVITIDEEKNRVINTVKSIKKHFNDCKISIDTYRSEVAQAAVNEGANIINDISGGELDDKMFEFLAKYKLPYILMHMKGSPQNMQQNTNYDDVLKEVYIFLYNKIQKLHQMGVNDIFIDVGFGFSKKREQNFYILKNLNYFKHLNKPILVGLSRKSMIYNTLEITSEDALNGTTALNMVALQNGATILRVHDVKEAIQTIKLFNELNNN
jgi:dihydropteroate synthase